MATIVESAAIGEANADAAKSAIAELAAQSEMLLKQLDQTNLPKLHYNLSQIERRAKSCRDKGRDRSDKQNFTKAHYLLAGSGVNVGQSLRELKALDLTPTFDDRVPAMPSAGLETMLKLKREQNIMNAIAESLAQSDREFQAYLQDAIASNWQKRRHRLIFDNTHTTTDTSSALSGTTESFGKHLDPSKSARTFGYASFADTELHSRVDLADIQTFQTQKTYSVPIKELNQARLRNEDFDLCSAFEKATLPMRQSSEPHQLQLQAMWRIIGSILAVSDEPDMLKRSRFRHVYSESHMSSQEAVLLKRTLALGAQKFLEKQSYEFVEAEISRNPYESKVGGVPSVTNKILGFLKYRYFRNGEWNRPSIEIVNNVPIWAFIFWLIRTGHVDEAAAWTIQHESWFQLIDRSFVAYIKAYESSDGRLPRQLLERIRAEFNQKLRFQPDIDPYRFGVYKILGRCDLSRLSLPDILPLTEDWMWLQLVLVREFADFSEVPEYDLYSLEDLQSKIVAAGSKHFNAKGTTPMIYAHVLLLSGQFERAIHYLYQYFQIDAVHLAVTLEFYGLLASSFNYKDQNLLIVTGDRLQINYPGVILSYARLFKDNDVDLTVDYIALISLQHSKKAEEISHEALADLILTITDLNRLLGDITPQGEQVSGSLQKKRALFELESRKDFMHDITFSAAVKADQENRFSDSILLYHFAEEYDLVLKTVNKFLSDALLVPEALYRPGEALKSADTALNLRIQAAESPVALARNFFKIYTTNANISAKISHEARNTCLRLMQILDAYNKYSSADWEACLDQIASIDLLPAQAEDVSMIRQRAMDLVNKDSALTKQVSGLLLLSMRCLTRLSEQIKQSSFRDGSKQQKIRLLKARSRNLVVFTANLEYRIPSSLIEEINRQDVLL